jgi:hypothetical protein
MPSREASCSHSPVSLPHIRTITVPQLSSFVSTRFPFSQAVEKPQQRETRSACSHRIFGERTFLGARGSLYFPNTDDALFYPHTITRLYTLFHLELPLGAHRDYHKRCVLQTPSAPLWDSVGLRYLA